MSFVLNVGAVLGVSLALSLRVRDSLVRTVPITLCSTFLLLYVLAFFRAMAWIDGLSALCLSVLLALFIRQARRRGLRQCLRTALAPLRDAQVWINLAILVAIVLLVHHRQILEWDGYSFWGADIKSLFYRGGFAEKNSNVAPGFGDYPPMLQLAVWWFLHLFGSCHEGLMFGGYYLFGTALLLSLTAHLRLSGPARKLAGGVLCGGALFLLPSVADVSWYRALYADPIMGILFGCLLVEIFFRRDRAQGYTLYRLCVLTASLCLTKTIGPLWAAFALLFLLVWRGWNAGTLKRSAVMLAVGGVSWGSWTVFCRLLARGSYLTQRVGPSVGARLEELLRGDFLSSGDNLAILRSFGRAFLTAPAHREHTWALDLSPCLVLLSILALFLIFWRVGWLTGRQTARLSGFFLALCAVTGLVLLWGHLTIFYGESQYTDPLNMVATMTRYGCPAATGFLMLAFAVAAHHLPLRARPLKASLAAWLPLLLILSSASYRDAANCLIPGADPLDPQRLALRAQYQSAMSGFLDDVARTVPLEGQGQRVLLLIDDSHYNPIISYCASPVSVQNVPAAQLQPFTAQNLADFLARSGARWLYVQDAPEEALSALAALVPGFRPRALCPI